MERYLQQESEETPYILLDPSGEIWVRGRSFPEEAGRFFEPVLNWLEEYKAAPPEETQVTIDLTSFNISSSKYLLYIIYQLQDVMREGGMVRIEWVYEEGDEDMIEVGNDYEAMARIPFSYRTRSPQKDLARLSLVNSS